MIDSPLFVLFDVWIKDIFPQSMVIYFVVFLRRFIFYLNLPHLYFSSLHFSSLWPAIYLGRRPLFIRDVLFRPSSTRLSGNFEAYFAELV
ncbi:MAG: hypothetical protein DRJ11_11270 [Candidatus Aminicenantes bacterium]|nr:MAG: hypothetical protein DRJ11_11270 [Candidatus Aminicenantes bacterium]